MAKGPVKDVSEVPEVEALLAVERELSELISANPEFYENLKSIVERRNGLATLADKRVRELGVSCGPFIQVSVTEKIDIERLYDELGDEQFKAVGGYTEAVTEYHIDKTRFLSYVASKNVPEEVVKVCVKESPSYKAVPKYVLP